MPSFVVGVKHWYHYYYYFYLFITIGAARSTSLEESVSFCEHLVECESTSRMQERICQGNNMFLPYWLPSENKKRHECYLKLRNDYIMLERIERQLDSQLLSCYIEQTMPLDDEHQRKCDLSLLKTVSELRNSSGHLVVDNCFQGTQARIQRQCSALQECCTARRRCLQMLSKSFLLEKKRERLQIIRRLAKDCELGMRVSELDLEKSKTKGKPPPAGAETSSKTEQMKADTTTSTAPLEGREQSSKVVRFMIHYNVNEQMNNTRQMDDDKSLVAGATTSKQLPDWFQPPQKATDMQAAPENSNTENSFQLSISAINGCVDKDSLRSSLQKWYAYLVSEISSELKRIPLANQRRINAILKRFEPLRQNLVLFQNENSRNGKGSAIGLEMAQERDETTINEEESNSSERRKGIEFEQRETNAAFRGVVGRNLSACDRYMRCHHQMVIGLDRCGVLSNLNSTSLSTESLLEVEDNKCLSKRHDEAYNHLYELVMKRNKKLRQCLGDEQNWECLRRESIQKIVVDEIKFDGIKSIRECYSNVNVLQFKCAQIRQCCPSYFTCREQTADAEVESQIISLTAALSAEKYRCVLKKKGRI